MRKLFVVIAILFSMSVKAQDTSYFYKRYELYRCIHTKVSDTATLTKYKAFNQQKKKRNNRIVTIITTTVFAGLTTWFFAKY